MRSIVRTERARHEIDHDVARAPRHHRGAKEHEPHERELGHLLRPAQRVVQHIAAEHLDQRDDDGAQQQDRRDGLDDEVDCAPRCVPSTGAREAGNARAATISEFMLLLPGGAEVTPPRRGTDVHAEPASPQDLVDHRLGGRALRAELGEQRVRRLAPLRRVAELMHRDAGRLQLVERLRGIGAVDLALLGEHLLGGVAHQLLQIGRQRVRASAR